MRNVLWVAAVIIGVVVFGVRKFVGRGTLVVVGAPDRAITVTVDGKNRHVAENQVERIPIKRGAQEITIQDGTEFRTRQVEIHSADDTVFVPAFDGACYALLDMSGAYVDKRGAAPQQQARMPTVVARLKDGEAYSVPEETYFMRIPKETYSDKVHYVRQVECSALDLDDEALAAEAASTTKVGR